jgi:hypothetical protein
MRDDGNLRDYFDTRPGIINTITEAALRVEGFNFETFVPTKELKKRSLIYVLYENYAPEHINALGGFVVWKKNYEAGIEGYREDIALTHYQEFTDALSDFADLALRWQETLCFQAMDQRSLTLLAEKKIFQEEPLRAFQIAIPKSYPRITLETPIDIQRLVTNPRRRITLYRPPVNA